MILANNRSTKLGTLICSAHARTVRPTGADRPASGPDRPLAHFWFEQLVYERIISLALKKVQLTFLTLLLLNLLIWPKSYLELLICPFR